MEQRNRLVIWCLYLGRRIDTILYVEEFLTEIKSSYSGFHAVSMILNTNLTVALLSILLMRKRCTQYLSHNQWIKANFEQLMKDSIHELLEQKHIEGSIAEL